MSAGIIQNSKDQKLTIYWSQTSIVFFALATAWYALSHYSSIIIPKNILQTHQQATRLDRVASSILGMKRDTVIWFKLIWHTPSYSYNYPQEQQMCINPPQMHYLLLFECQTFHEIGWKWEKYKNNTSFIFKMLN